MGKHNLLTIKPVSQAEAWRILDETLAAIKKAGDGPCDECGVYPRMKGEEICWYCAQEYEDDEMEDILEKTH